MTKKWVNRKESWSWTEELGPSFPKVHWEVYGQGQPGSQWHPCFQGSLPLLPLSSWQKSQSKSQWRAASWRERSRFPCSWQNAVVDSQWEELSLYMKPGVMRLSVQCWSVLMRTVWLILYCTHFPVFPWYPPHQKKKESKKMKKEKSKSISVVHVFTGAWPNS